MIKETRKYIIGIDPDIEKSGLAVLDTKLKSFEMLTCLNFPFLIERICTYDINSVTVVVEAGWKVSTNFHVFKNHNPKTAAEIGNRTGRNHAVAILISEVLRHRGYHVIDAHPLKKCWKGRDGKISSFEFNSITGFSKRSNQEMRDSGLIAWVYAELPIFMKYRSK